VAKPPIVVDLVWTSGLTFSGRSGSASITLDSAGVAGPSPVQALVFAAAGCMMTDVAHILAKGHHAFSALGAQLVADRAGDDPHRILRMKLSITVAGRVPADAVERAIALSREKYCSVWHSMRQDIEFTTTFRVEAAEPAG
jgi:putative redox protein